MPDTPLRPDELEMYKTDVQTDAEAPDTGVPTPGGDARPWMLLAVVVLVIFVVMLIAWLAFGLAS